MTSPFTVLVNSSDGFADCWNPFFTLLTRYWPQLDAPILLNTEAGHYEHRGLPICCTRVQDPGRERLTWSECLLAALSRITTPLVLYFQEDYFIHSAVRDDLVQRAARHMLAHPQVGHIALTRLGSHDRHESYAEPWLERIPARASYRICTQAALWRVDTLMSYLAPEENGWMFEIYGTWRAWRRNDCFLRARFDGEYGSPAIEYLHTGIIKGRWLSEIRDVFDRNGIQVDYSKRGFYRPKHPLLRKIETAHRLLERPQYLMRQLF